MLPTEPNTSATIKNISALWLSPDEWMIYGKNVDKNLKLSLDNEISKLNYGAITDVSNQWVCFNLKGERIYDLLSAGSPFNFNDFKEKRNKVAQTLLNHIDVTINQKQSNEVDLFVRRSFAEPLCSWMNDSARFI